MTEFGFSKRKDRIAEVAFRTIREQGHLQLSMNQLAQLSGIPYSTLYRCFPSKSDLFSYCQLRVLQALPASLSRLARMRMSAMEKLVTYACFPFYCCSLNQGYAALVFSGANTVLAREASPESRQQIGRAQQALFARRWQFFSHTAAAGVGQVSEVELRHTYRLLTVVSRGGAMVTYQRELAAEGCSLDEMIDFSVAILTELPWQGAAARLSRHLVKSALRTLSDNGPLL